MIADALLLLAGILAAGGFYIAAAAYLDYAPDYETNYPPEHNAPPSLVERTCAAALLVIVAIAIADVASNLPEP